MNKIVLTMVLLVSMASYGAGAEQRFMVDLTFYEDEREVTVDSIEVVETDQLTSLNERDGNYQFQFKDSSGETIYEGKTVISFRAVGPPGPEGGQGVSEIVDKRTTFFVFDYDNRMNFFEIRNNGDLVKRINLCRFHNESAPNCSTGRQQVQQIQDQSHGMIILLAVIVLSVLAIILYRRRIS